MTLLFSTDDLAAMAGLKQCFDPLELFNPGKVFPSGRGCGELAALRRDGISAAERDRRTRSGRCSERGVVVRIDILKELGVI